MKSPDSYLDMGKISYVKPSLLLMAFLTVAAPQSLSGQSYNTALGMRWGDGIGITAKQRILKRTSLEGIFYQHHKSDQTVAGLMIDHHMPVLTRRLNIYAGGGLGWVSPDKTDKEPVSYNAVMINAGLEFTIARLNMSWDFVPVIPISQQEQSLTTMTAFSLRYVLIKKSKNGLFGKDNKPNKKNKHRKNRHKKNQKRRS